MCYSKIMHMCIWDTILESHRRLDKMIHVESIHASAMSFEFLTVLGMSALCKCYGVIKCPIMKHQKHFTE